MKKIRIVAFLLLLVMVVSTFVGCTLPGNEELETKVETLDGQLGEQASALTDIQAAIEALSKALEEDKAPEVDLSGVESEIAANKQSIADILAAIDALKKAIDEMAEKDKLEDNSAEALKLAIATANTKIDTLEAAFELNKAHYTADAIVAIRTIFGEARVLIPVATSVEQVNTILTKMENDLAGYKRVDDTIYNYVLALDGKLSDKTEKLVKEASAALEVAKAFYANNPTALTKYAVSADKTIDLVKAIEEIVYAQTVLYPIATVEAKNINNAIDTYKPLQNSSVVFLVVEIGGFYKMTSGKLVEVTAKELNEYVASAGAITTIAQFMAKYEKYGFGSLIKVADYDKHIAAVEANIAKMETTLKAFLDNYATTMGKNTTFVVTTENMNVVFALEEFLDAWTMIGRTDFAKVVYAGSNYDVKEYNIESILTKYKITAAELNNKMMSAETWITNAKDIKTMAEVSVSLYALMNRIYKLDASIYDFANLAISESNLAKGILSIIPTVKTVNNTTTTTWSIEYIAFVDGKYTTRAVEISHNGTETEVVDYFVANYKVMNIIELIETAMIVEDIFVNQYNSGKTYAPIVEARNGWMTENTQYGFGYVRYKTYLALGGRALAERDAKAIAQTTNYNDLRSAVYAISGRVDTTNWTDIKFGDLVIYDCN